HEPAQRARLRRPIIGLPRRVEMAGHSLRSLHPEPDGGSDEHEDREDREHERGEVCHRGPAGIRRGSHPATLTTWEVAHALWRRGRGGWTAATTGIMPGKMPRDPLDSV